MLFYAADKDAGARHAAARQLLQDAAGPRAALTEQVLFEFYHSATRKKRIPANEAASIISDLARNFTLIFAPETIVEDVLRLVSRHRLSVWAARVLAVCAANECRMLLSEDLRDGATYDGVRVLNPFVPKNAAAVGELLIS